MMKPLKPLLFVLPILVPMAIGGLLAGAGTGPTMDDVRKDLASEDVDVRRDAIQWMGATRRVSLMEDIAPFLQSEDKKEVEDAVEALGDIENPNALPLLEAAFDNPAAKPKDVAKAMRNIDYPHAIPYLQKRLNDPDEKIRENAETYITELRKALNQEVCFYSVGMPIYNGVGQAILSQAVLFEEGRQQAATGWTLDGKQVPK